MRTLPAGLASALSSGNSTNLVKLFKITRKDATVIRFCLAQADIVIGDETFVPARGVYCGALPIAVNQASGALTIEVSAVDGGTFDFGDLMRGAFDDATLEFSIGDHATPANGKVLIFTGYIGGIQLGSAGQASFEARGLLSKTKFLMTEHFTPTCRAYFGDRRCKVPAYPSDVARSTAYAVGDYVRARLASDDLPSDYGNLVFKCTTAGTTGAADPSPYYSGPATTTVTDGTAVFTAENSLVRHAQVVSRSGFDIVLKNVATPIHTFELGVLIPVTGKNKGKSIEIKSWNAGTLTATCFLEPSLEFVADDWVELIPGCDYTNGAAGCLKYSNILNFRGEPFAPGEDAVNINYTAWGS